MEGYNICQLCFDILLPFVLGCQEVSVCNTEWLWLMFCAGHGKSQMSSVMQSESEVSSEEETIFMNQRKPNGVAGGNVSVRRKPVTNGSTKAGTKTKVSA